MNVFKLIIYLFITTAFGCSSSDDISKEKINSETDLEILSKSDMIYNGRPFVWKCYSIDDVTPNIDTWNSEDPLGPHNIITKMCSLKISVKNNIGQNEYYDHRGRNNIYCDEFLNAWKKLTLDQTKICIAGRPIKTSTAQKKTTESLMHEWMWDKIKTKKGCYSFWDDYQCSDF